MSWFLLFIAGILEVIWASSLHSASTLIEWIVVVCLIAISFIMLIYTYKKIPVAIAYSVYVGIGTIGTYIVSIFLGNPFSFVQGIALLGLLAGIIGLKLTTNEQTKAEGSHV